MVTQAPATQLADSTDATLRLLRELRRARSRKQVVNVAYWLYLAAVTIFSYGGWLVAAIVRALRRPPPALPATPMLLRAAPAGLCTLALLMLVFLLWDARWRGPVVVAQPTADWLLDTPIRRGPLLRPRYRASVLRFTPGGCRNRAGAGRPAAGSREGGSGLGESLHDSLARWHAFAPCLALAVLAGCPAAALAIIAGHTSLLPLTAVTIAVLVGGALVSSFRGQLEGEMFAGFDTPLGHSSGVTITLWACTGPLLAVGPMIILWYAAITSARTSLAIPETVISAALAWWLFHIAARRASRLKSTSGG